jgi:hypothetical protein
VRRALGREREFDHVHRLEPEVELLEDDLGEQFDESGEVRHPRLGEHALRDTAHQRHHADVGLELPAQTGPPDLHDDLRAVAERCAMRLRDRRRGDRDCVERREDLADRLAERSLDDAFGDAGL